MNRVHLRSAPLGAPPEHQTMRDSSLDSSDMRLIERERECDRECECERTARHICVCVRERDVPKETAAADRMAAARRRRGGLHCLRRRAQVGDTLQRPEARAQARAEPEAESRSRAPASRLPHRCSSCSCSRGLGSGPGSGSGH